MAQLKIVYWNHIPGQVVTRKGRKNKRLRLSEKFSDAIERASYRLKKQGKDAEFEPWNQIEQSFEGDVDEAADQLINQLEENYNSELLERLIRACGFNEPESSKVAS